MYQDLKISSKKGCFKLVERDFNGVSTVPGEQVLASARASRAADSHCPVGCGIQRYEGWCWRCYGWPRVKTTNLFVATGTVSRFFLRDVCFFGLLFTFFFDPRSFVWGVAGVVVFFQMIFWKAIMKHCRNSSISNSYNSAAKCEASSFEVQVDASATFVGKLLSSSRAFRTRSSMGRDQWSREVAVASFSFGCCLSECWCRCPTSHYLQQPLQSHRWGITKTAPVLPASAVHGFDVKI